MVCLPEVESVYIASKNDSFNLEAEISTLLADSSRSSFALPRELNAEQRKHAKKTVEQYPDLKCESFGFGKDRKMHLFKRKAGQDSTREDQVPRCSPQHVSVKNTFIDDWISADVTPADARIVQSMPHNMFGQSLSAELYEEFDALCTGEGDDFANVLVQSKEALPSNGCFQEQFFALGTEVVIQGLVKAPSFNGAWGVVQSWDAETGRYNVQLACAAINGQRLAKIKGENLREAL